MITVYITDDHKIMVDSVTKIVNDRSDENGIKIEKCFYDGASCLKGLKTSLPDVLILDIQLQDCDGIELCAQIMAKYHDLKIIMLTSFSESSIVKRAFNNGAKGYILKNVDIKEFLEGVRVVNEGKTFISRDIRSTIEKTKDDSVWLTNREKEILKLLAEGLSTYEIAGKLLRDEETIRSHRKNILLKLEAKNVAEAVKIGIEKRLIF